MSADTRRGTLSPITVSRKPSAQVRGYDTDFHAEDASSHPPRRCGREEEVEGQG
jgi:hypothetical protein